MKIEMKRKVGLRTVLQAREFLSLSLCQHSCHESFHIQQLVAEEETAVTIWGRRGVPSSLMLPAREGDTLATEEST